MYSLLLKQWLYLLPLSDFGKVFNLGILFTVLTGYLNTGEHANKIATKRTYVPPR